ncbi:MAG: tripartite tricarboxylate transporter substrate binding protein, partial [Desulfobacterales bacterium]|nr:tripartite tricarboxylate transporter substrate binding protein [Desulfobacterales bacterium]
MKKERLNVLFIAALTMVLSMGVLYGESRAEYPDKAIRFLIPFGVGGGADTIGRALAKGAEPSLGEPAACINRPGASGGIMYSALKASKADGYTVGWNSLSVLTTTNIGNVPFPYDAFEHVCRIGYTGMPIAVRADSPWKTIGELVEYARKNPGKLKIGNAGTGSGTHLIAVLLAKEADVNVVHVPLGVKRRTPALLGGEVEAICAPAPGVSALARAGKIRLLVMSTAKRDPNFPDIPTFTESGYPIVMDLFRGISVPKGVPAPIIQKLESVFKKASESRLFRHVAKKKGFTISFQDGEEFGR